MIARNLDLHHFDDQLQENYQGTEKKVIEHFSP